MFSEDGTCSIAFIQNFYPAVLPYTGWSDDDLNYVVLA